MKKKILITGSTGFIGRNLSEQLSSKFNVKAVASQELNLLEEEKVKSFLDKERFDVVIHCAVYNTHRNLDKDSGNLLRDNLRMFFNLYRCSYLYGRMLHFGSGAEYDRRYYTPKMNENYFGTHVPMDDYGFSKYVIAKFIGYTDNIYDLRLFGCFGKYEDWKTRFVSNTICRVIFNLDILIKKNICFDYLYINDLIKIIKWFIETKKITYHDYNICTGKTVDLVTIVKKTLSIEKKNLKVNFLKTEFQKEYSGNNSRLLEEMGGFTFTPMNVAIEELYSWYKKNNKNIDKKLL